MHKSDVINIQNDDIYLQTVPFDSGVIQSNYYFNVMAYVIYKPIYASLSLYAYRLPPVYPQSHSAIVD